MPDAGFYILSNDSEAGRLHFACKLAEKAYRTGSFCYILTENERQGKILDDLLWTFRPGSFVPHEWYSGVCPAHSDRILIGILSPPEAWQKIVINLSSEVPENYNNCERVLEILNNDESIKLRGREHYKRYRDAGFNLSTHTV
ncbi:MAG: DNA polymerase III subunit chi [Gammaproteobacteria bacterium]